MFFGLHSLGAPGTDVDLKTTEDSGEGQVQFTKCEADNVSSKKW